MTIASQLEYLDIIIEQNLNFSILPTLDHTAAVQLLDADSSPLTHYAIFRYIRAIMRNYAYTKKVETAVYHGKNEVGTFYAEVNPSLAYNFQQLLAPFSRHIALEYMGCANKDFWTLTFN